MTPDDSDRDPVIELLASLPAHDVSAPRAWRLRRRCHAALESRTARLPATGDTRWTWRLAAAAGLAGAWSAVYLFETIRLAAAIYGLR